MQRLSFTSCQAPMMDETFRAIAHFVGRKLEIAIDFIDNIPWQARYLQIDAGAIDVAWICSAPYVRRIDQQSAPIELLAAPVWMGERYADRPVYFSDLVVASDSRYDTFEALRGATWVYNEPGSFSGFEAMRYFLAMQGLDEHFFGRVVASGAHQQSLAMILAHKADIGAIDSTVLEEAQRADPSLRERLRTVAVVGPSPIPPWVISRKLADDLRERMRQVFIAMADDQEGQAILTRGAIERFAAVQDRDYDPTRMMLRQAQTILIEMRDSECS